MLNVMEIIYMALHFISSSSFALVTFIVMNVTCIGNECVIAAKAIHSFQDDFVFRNKLLQSYKLLIFVIYIIYNVKHQ